MKKARKVLSCLSNLSKPRAVSNRLNILPVPYRFHTVALALTCFVLLAVSVSAQPIGSWTSFTSRSTVTALEKDTHGRIWALTEGGIFALEGQDIVHQLATTEGMHRVNAQAISSDPQGNRIWMGYSDGTFQSYDPDSQTIRTFTDIARATRFNPRGVNGLLTHAGNLYIASDFGIVVFDPDRGITLDTYTNLGTFPSGSRVESLLVHEGMLYAATPQGVAIAELDAPDLVVPQRWSTYEFASGARQLFVWEGAVNVHTGNRIERHDADAGWQSVDYFQGDPVTRLSVSAQRDVLLSWSENRLHLRRSGQPSVETIAVSGGWPWHAVLAESTEGRLYVGTTNQGIRMLSMQNGEEIDRKIPDGPFMNSFSGINARGGILASGSNDLWGRRGTGSRESGYYLFREGQWHNFNVSTSASLQEFDIHSVFTSASTDEYFFFGSWGRGIVQHHRETDEITVWNRQNSALEGISVGSNYIVITGMNTDRDQNLWAVSWLSPNLPLYRFDTRNNEWTGIPRLQGLAATNLYNSVTVDSHGQLWIPLLNESRAGRGMVVKRVDGDVVTDGVWLRDQAGEGNLPDAKVNAVVQDRRGEIWVGTDRGLVRYAFPQLVIDGGPSERQAAFLLNADETAGSPFLLRTANITSIVVNSANQKWVGTDGEGVWLIDEDGGRHRAIRNFTAENSPLSSNTITGLAYDEVTGQVFMATDLGLVSYTDVVRGSVSRMEELFVYPNPFSYNRESSERVVIDRLSERTIIRILTVDGRLIRRLESRGGRVEWDMRDFQGSRVGTGVYLIVAADQNDDQRGVGRLVVVR